MNNEFQLFLSQKNPFEKIKKKVGYPQKNGGHDGLAIEQAADSVGCSDSPTGGHLSSPRFLTEIHLAVS